MDHVKRCLMLLPSAKISDILINLRVYTSVCTANQVEHLLINGKLAP